MKVGNFRSQDMETVIKIDKKPIKIDFKISLFSINVLVRDRSYNQKLIFTFLKRMNQITISDFSQEIQTIINQAQITGDTLTIIKDGIPLAIIQPLSNNDDDNDQKDLLQICDEIGKNAQARGLTEEILTELLADES